MIKSPFFKLRRIECSLVITIATTATGFGQTSWIPSSYGFWNAAANWTSGVPTTGVNALIANNGYASMLSITGAAGTITVGSSTGTGILEIFGSTLSSTGTTRIGNGSSIDGGYGNNGTATVFSSTWNNAGDIHIGESGKGEVIIASGGIVRAGWNGTAATGTVTLGFSGTAGGKLTMGSNNGGGTLQAARVTGGSGSGIKQVIFNSNGPQTFAPILEGNLSVQQSGLGTTTLSGINTYTGGTILSAGTLVMGNASALGTTGTVNISAGATLNRSTFDFELSRLSGSGSLNGSGAYVYNSAANSSLGTALVGGTTLTKLGTGTLTLSGPATYSGATTISGGMLEINADNILPDGTAVETNNGTLRIASDRLETIGSLAVSSAGSAQISGTLITGGNNASTTYAGALSGDGTLRKVGTGTLLFTGTGTFMGTIFVDAGKLTLGNGGTLGTISGNFLELGIASGASLEANRSDAVSYAFRLSGTGTLIKSGVNALTLSGQLNDFTGTVAINSGQLVLNSNFSFPPFSTTGPGVLVTRQTLYMRGTLGHTGGTIIETGTLNLQPAGSATYSSNFSGPGALSFSSQSGSATITYAGTATHTGGTLFNSNVQLNDGSSLAGSINLGSRKLIINQSVSQTLTNAFVSNSGGTISQAGSGALTLGSSLSGLTSNPTLEVTGSGTLTLGAASSLAGGCTKSGPGKLIIAATLTTSEINITAGTLQIGNGGTAGALEGNIYGRAGELRFDRTDAISFNGNIAGSGTSVIKTGSTSLTLGGELSYSGPTILEGGSLTIGNSGDWSHFSAISGNGSLIKTGSGSVSLNALSTHTGGTFIQSGTLALSRSAAIAGTATVSAGAILDLAANGSFTLDVTGAGEINLGYVGATLNGTLTHTGATTISGGTLSFGDARDFTYSSPTSGVTGTLVKKGSGTATVLSALTQSYLNVDAGTLRLGNGSVFDVSEVRINPSGTLSFDHATDLTFAGRFTNEGTLKKMGSNKVTLTGNLGIYTGATVIEGGSLEIFTSAFQTISGAVSGAGTLIKSGPDSLTLDSRNTVHAGGILIKAGTLLLNNSGAISSLTPVTLEGGQLNLQSSNQSIGSLSGLAGTFVRMYDVSLTVGAENTSTTYAGTIIGNSSGRLIKTGTGTLTLGGTNTLNASTTINGGKLMGLVNGAFGSSSILVQGGALDLNGLTLANVITINSGGTLTGTGTLTATTTASGTLSPGDSGFGRITASGGLNLAPTSVIALGLGGTSRHNGMTGNYDTLAVSGALDLKGTVNVALLNGFVPVAGNTFTLATATSFTGNMTLNLPLLPGNLAWDSSLFATTGTVSVIIQQGFATWQGAQFTTLELADPLVSGPSADPDQDGFNNILEYALGTLPKSAASANVSQTEIVAGRFEFTYQRPLGGGAIGVSYVIEESNAALSGWVVATDFTQSVVAASATMETVTISFPASASGRKFARVSATLN